MNANPTSDTCEFLPWDTDFFGFRVGRVAGHFLTKESARQIMEWARDQSIECLYFLATLDDPETTHLAQIHGFELVDIRVTFELDLRKAEMHQLTSGASTRIRAARPDDLSELESIARCGYGLSRFYADPRFPGIKPMNFTRSGSEKAAAGMPIRFWLQKQKDDPSGS